MIFSCSRNPSAARLGQNNVIGMSPHFPSLACASYSFANGFPAATVLTARFYAGYAVESAFVMPKSVSLHSSPLAIPIRWTVCRRPSPRSCPGSKIIPARLRHFSCTSHGLLLAQPYHSELWFSPSSASLFSATRGRSHGGGPDGLNGGADGDYKPPDERVLKLGKSRFNSLWTRHSRLMLIIDFAISSANPLSTSSEHPHQPFACGDSVPAHHFTSLSVNTSPFTECQRSGAVPSSAMDGASGLEQRPLGGEC
jgi:hypothetical protein